MEITNVEGMHSLATCHETILSSWNPDVQRTRKKIQSRIKGITTAYCEKYLHGTVLVFWSS